MTKRTRNFISFILTLCLLLSILPAASAAAASEQSTGSIAEATATVEEPTTTQDELPILQLDADCQILKHVDEEAFAAGKHIARLPEEETLSSYVFLNADGSKTAYFMDQPVKFTDADGSIKEKNLTLTAATEGYTTTQNDIQLTLPTDPTSGIRIVYNNRMITLIPQGGTLTASAQVANNSVTYPDYYGEGMSLRYTPTLSGVKEDILLDAYAGINRFTFRLNTGGLNLYQANGRYFLAESKTGTDRIVLGDVVVYDANSKFSMGTLTSQTIMPGQAYLLTLTVDEAFLTDEATAYPVTIDPTLEVSDNTTAGSIEDATIYEGKPTLNTGTWQYNRAGYYDSSYGVGHIVVRLKGLLESNEYINISADNITSATFNIKDADSGAAGTLYLYPMHSNSTWTETGITWGNKGTYVGIAYDTVSVGSNQWASFDITDLLKDWKNGNRNPNAGFIIDASSQNTRLKSFYSSENTTTAYRPYVTMTYASSLTLSQTTTSVQEGYTTTLSVTSNTGNQPISWRSSSQAVATVNNGVVTAIKAGQTVITATTPDGSSGSCVVYVKIVDGVYYIKNYTSGYYMSAQSGGISAGTRIVQTPKTSSTSDGLWQLWKIRYLSNGQYSIRPLHKLDMGLGCSSAPLLMYIGTTDTYSTTNSYARWSVQWSTSGYVFSNNGKSGYALCTSSTSDDGTYINAATGDIANVFRWTLERTTTNPKVILYASDTGRAVENMRRGVAPSQTSSLSDINLTYTFSSSISLNQSVTWASMNSSIATVNSSTGAVTGVAIGTTTIYATAQLNGTAYSAYYTLVVSEIPISGSELEYDPDIWNIFEVKWNTNCYAYALNNQIYPDSGGFSFLQPGELAGLVLSDVPLTTDNVISYVQADAAAQGFMFAAIDKNDCCPTGSYKVALVIDDGSDYHWYRQNPDGTWSHKLGENPVANLDASGSVITNPETADNNYSSHQYTDYVGFYCISPLNNMYNASNATNLSVNAILAENERPNLCLSDVSSITPGMAYDDVVSEIGAPHRYLEARIIVAEYDLVDGTVFIVKFIDRDNQLIVESCQIGGSCIYEENY